MTVPSTNINMITHIRNGFMQDTSGNASLTSNKYRDGAMKGTGNVSITDFAGRAWSQGRTIKRTMDGDSAASVRPYCWDQRWDNLNASDVTFTLSYENGLPRWRYAHNSSYFGASASYNNSYFYCPNSTGFVIQGAPTTHSSTGSVRHDFSVIGFQDGYLSGGSITHIDQMLIGELSRSRTFTTDSRFPYILVSFRGWLPDGTGNKCDFSVAKAEVRKV